MGSRSTGKKGRRKKEKILSHGLTSFVWFVKLDRCQNFKWGTKGGIPNVLYLSFALQRIKVHKYKIIHSLFL